MDRDRPQVLPQGAGQYAPPLALHHALQVYASSSGVPGFEIFTSLPGVRLEEVRGGIRNGSPATGCQILTWLWIAASALIVPSHVAGAHPTVVTAASRVAAARPA